MGSPTRVGNQSCACLAPEATAKFGCGMGKAAPTDPSAATQYLMIGDSISLGMRSDVTQLLAPHGWSVEHNPGNAASANKGAHCLTDWVRPESRKWDVISYQFGLHDIAFDVERVSVEQYTALLANITAALVGVQKSTGAKLLWVRTTPVPTVPTYDSSPTSTCNDVYKCLNPPRYAGDVVLYNHAADGVIAAAQARGAQIAVLDMYSYVLKQCGGQEIYANCSSGFQLPINVHFSDAGWTGLAQQMSAALLAL